MSIFGRRTVEVGDVIAIDTPYLNGIAKVIAGPDTERGTKSFPKFLFKFQRGFIADPSTGFLGTLKGEEIWLEDNAKHVSIFGVDDENISFY